MEWHVGRAPPDGGHNLPLFRMGWAGRHRESNASEVPQYPDDGPQRSPCRRSERQLPAAAEKQRPTAPGKSTALQRSPLRRPQQPGGTLLPAQWAGRPRNIGDRFAGSAEAQPYNRLGGKGGGPFPSHAPSATGRTLPNRIKRRCHPRLFPVLLLLQNAFPEGRSETL